MYKNVRKWRIKKTAQILCLVTLSAFLLVLISPKSTVAESGWYNFSWPYRCSITVNNSSNSNTLENYQVQVVVIYDSDMQSDFDDLRFTENDGTTELSYWFENYNSGENATVWVKVPTIPASDNHTIYMYYGNASASSESNGDNTFEFFDDFSGTSLDMNKWENGAHVADAEYSINNSVLDFEGTGEDFEYFKTKTFTASPPIILRAKQRDYIAYHYPAEMAFGYRNYHGVQGAPADEWAAKGVYTGDKYCAAARAGGSESAGSTVTVDDLYHIFEVVWTTSRVSVFKDGSEVSYATSCIPTSSYFVSIGHPETAAPNTWKGSWDWILVRKYASPEPTCTIGDEEFSIPSQPQLQQPENFENTGNNTPTFTWVAGMNAENHRLIVDNSQNFSDGDNFLDITLGASATSYTVPSDNSLPDGKWYWKVVAINSTGENSSPPRTLTVDTAPPPSLSLSSPDNNHATDNSQVTFSWSGGEDNTDVTSDVSGIIHYELWVDNDLNFSTPTVVENTSDNTTLSLTKEVSGKLYWRVRAWDRAGNAGAFSQTRYLTVFSFSLSASSTSLHILRGGTGGTTLSISVVFGDAETVSLSYDWPDATPSGVTPSFSATSGTAPFTSAISFQTNGDASTGEFTCKVIATSTSGITKNIDIDVVISGMSFIVMVSPSSLSMTRSENAASTISVKFMMGAKENVTLTGSWHGTAPTGVSASLSPSVGTPSYDATLSLATSSSASSGTYTYRVTGSGGGLEQWTDVTVEISTSLSITLFTDKTSYKKAQTINISGTAQDPNGDPVGEGTATITLSSGTWSDTVQTSISNGTYSSSYYITYDKPEGTWTISATAVDDRGHETLSLENTSITVSVPESHKHYTVSISSPSAGEVFERGDTVTFTINLTENGRKVRGAIVRVRKPSGEDIFLSEGSPGTYSGSYLLGKDDDLGQWSIYVEGTTNKDGVIKAGFNYMSINVKPTSLMISLLEPTKTSFEIGETVKVKLEVSYPDGTPMGEGVITGLGPNGENLVFVKEEIGMYTSTYVVQSTGMWGFQVSAMDAYGNSGSTTEITIQFTAPTTVSYLIRYWWTVMAAALAVGSVATFIVRSKLRVRKLASIRREVLELERLKKEKAVEYFTKGSISRETYDELLQEYEKRITELEKKERLLKRKIKKEVIKRERSRR